MRCKQDEGKARRGTQEGLGCFLHCQVGPDLYHEGAMPTPIPSVTLPFILDISTLNTSSRIAYDPTIGEEQFLRTPSLPSYGIVRGSSIYCSARSTIGSFIKLNRYKGRVRRVLRAQSRSCQFSLFLSPNLLVSIRGTHSGRRQWLKGNPEAGSL